MRFDRNDYTIPPTYVRRTLTVMASPSEVRVLDGAAVIAAHPRSYDKGEQVEDPTHIAELTARKRQARQHRGTDRLAQAAPNSRELLARTAERGDNLGSITATLLRLLDRYGAAELEAGILVGPPLGFLPWHRSDKFPRSTQAPESGSRHLHAGGRLANTQVPARLIPE